MATISPTELALELLNHCLRGSDWPEDVLEALLECAADAHPDRAREGSHALFGILAERMSDLFEPALCDAYAALFSRAIGFVVPELNAADLLARYQRIRHPRRFEGDPTVVRDVFVLSRVTLGADVNVTSILLDAAKRRFPEARIHFVATRKNWELFAADPRLRWLPVRYRRGDTIEGRLAIWPRLRRKLSRSHSIVLDPDSRLTQLGLLPVCPEENYFFFESRSYGDYSADSLTALARRWVGETLGVEEAGPYFSPAAAPIVEAPGLVTLSFGVGDNPAKRIPDPFEAGLLSALAARGLPLLIDTGAGGEEAERVHRAVWASAASPERVRVWRGAFAPFAATIARSRLFIGYDSAGGHVAAAAGTPLISIFAGFPSPRMFSRWRPAGAGPVRVLRIDDPHPERTLQDVLSAADALLAPSSAAADTRLRRRRDLP